MTIHTAPVAATPGSGRKLRPRTWVVVAAVFWGAVLATGVGWALARGGPTAREQTTVAQAVPVVDRVVSEVAHAVSEDGQAVAAMSGPDQIDSCQISVLRKGAQLRRSVTVAVTPGTEAALLQRIAARLPPAYAVKVSTGSVPRLVADAGFWVQLTATTGGKGVVRFVADTGSCRAAGDLPAAASENPLDNDAKASTSEPQDGPPDRTQGTNRTEAQTVLARLGLSADEWHTYRSSCPGGGEISTVEAVSSPDLEPGAFTELLIDLGKAVVATPDEYAFTNGPRHVAVRHDQDRVVVTSTTDC